MSDFTSGFWSPYIAIVTIVSLLACGGFLRLFTTRKLPKGTQAETMGHVWDDDLSELNNPLPNWWRWLFYITLIFAFVYLALYPGLGKFAGMSNWTSQGQYEAERTAAQQKFGPLFEKYLKQDVIAVAADPEAHQMGERLFLTYCSQCHGSDAGGSKGFPNLRDRDWLYGGDPEAIKTSIAAGRAGAMPALGPSLGPDGVTQVANYVLSLSGSKHDASLAEQGKEKFAMCAACHGPDGSGNQQLGAPNLRDNTWLYGGDIATLTETINNGRANRMPAHAEFLGEGKVHVLAAYVYGLSQKQ